MSDWNEAIEAAAKIAREGCLVPPDGGSPTLAEINFCDDISSEILRLKRPAPLDGGWALVPREPTVEMIDSSCAAWWKLHPAFPGEKSEPTAGDTVAAIYRAMLAAAPASTEKAEGER